MKIEYNKLAKIIREEIENSFLKNIIDDLGGPNTPYKRETVSLVDDPKCVDPGTGRFFNRPVKINGEVQYLSRSVVVSLKVICKNKYGEWCILANKRGKGTTNSGRWNTPVGYLDYNEDLKNAAVRECFEETGVKVNPFELVYLGQNSVPSGKKQDVVIYYGAILRGVTDYYKTTNKFAEPDEVEEVRWIPVSQVRDYNWNWRRQLDNVNMLLNRR